jgi:uncharacterized protein YhfF
MRDRLVSAVLAGEKVATSSLLAQYEDEGEPLPMAGECRAMIGSSGEEVAVVEVLEVSVIRLGDADERLARDEGEGFRSVAEWRNAHEDFWRRDVLPDLRQRHELDDDTELVVERFRVVGKPSR